MFARQVRSRITRDRHQLGLQAHVEHGGGLTQVMFHQLAQRFFCVFLRAVVHGMVQPLVATRQHADQQPRQATEVVIQVLQGCGNDR